jgi:glycosyltransferase involved in cell wall biosynthesis
VGILAALEAPGVPRDRIVLAGFVPDDELAALYSGATAFVYPSLYEGFGLPPLEAMTCGVPVIASNTSSLPEVVGEAGILLDPHDADGLSQAMLALYRDGRLRAELAARSLARAECFGWERFTRRTLDAYRAALAA